MNINNIFKVNFLLIVALFGCAEALEQPEIIFVTKQTNLELQVDESQKITIDTNLSVYKGNYFLNGQPIDKVELLNQLERGKNKAHATRIKIASLSKGDDQLAHKLEDHIRSLGYEQVFTFVLKS
ncbi:hypothetical protein DES40_1202 [Litorimonas taeanensis]|uniref:Biopolymer transport protein ExbD n=1 Tax=Litorimonas taeanensis TaxID=568099 RepID=A0A420WLK5_9PROT|nr:hypothetical protein [Litorimonas taeanensis]RKQ71870.1 hypothetical protein DES40_1202 [Litorimonas taeanensis]